jgi:hypothetical protein
MELRRIPFIGGDGFRIDREGAVFKRQESRGRSRGSKSIAWVLCKPISLDEAVGFAKSRARDEGTKLVIPARQVSIDIPSGGTWSRILPTAVRRVSYLANPPVDAGLLIGEAMQARGDLDSNWFFVTNADRWAHLFHGPSVARDVFAVSDV